MSLRSLPFTTGPLSSLRRLLPPNSGGLFRDCPGVLGWSLDRHNDLGTLGGVGCLGSLNDLGCLGCFSSQPLPLPLLRWSGFGRIQGESRDYPRRASRQLAPGSRGSRRASAL